MLFVTIVLDGVGIGAQPDAEKYGDAGSNTLAHICEATRPQLPHLRELGLGCIAPLTGIPAVVTPKADYGRMLQTAAGKDSISGHWELAGVRLDRPFPTYPHGFPPSLIRTFLDRTGYEQILGNKPASGTAIIDELGALHQETGHPIVYTSADSVFQITAHRETIDYDELYRICDIARNEVCLDHHAVGRVIARPFIGSPGSFTRVSTARKDYALHPPARTVQEALRQKGIRTVSVGKISALFAGVGFDAAYNTKTNVQGISETIEQIHRAGESITPTFIWVNLVDFDQDYGHRNDPDGFARALEAFDAAVPELIEGLSSDSVLAITADHGNDPTDLSTDHSREYVPLLVYHGKETGRSLGIRSTFADHAATVAAYFRVPFLTSGTAFI